MSIMLPDIWSIPFEDQKYYKIHFAIKEPNGGDPLRAFINNELIEWQRFRPAYNDFNRDYIFSVVRFHEYEYWLFTGIWCVLERHDDRYEVALTGHGKAFIGRLVLWSQGQKPIRPKLETYYSTFRVVEILRECYK